MPRFFFHLEDYEARHDDEGTELDGLEDAKCAAVQLIAETLCHQPMKFWEANTYKVTVTDADGLHLFVVEMVSTVSPAISQARPRTLAP